MARECPGPLDWHGVLDATGAETGAAVMQCSACDYVTTTGQPLDVEHVWTPVRSAPYPAVAQAR